MRNRASIVVSSVVLLLPMLTAACAGPETGDEAPDPGVWSADEAWHLAETPRLNFAEFEPSPAHEFTRIRSAYQLDDGRIMATNHVPPEVRVFRSDGEVDWIRGGEGGGPGEFRAIMWAAPVEGEGIVVYDPFQARTTRLAPDGEVRELIGITEFPGPRGPMGLVMGGRFSDGSYIGRPNAALEGAGSGSGRNRLPYFRMRLDGSIIDTIGIFDRIDYMQGPEGRPTAPVLGRRAVWLAHGDRLFHGMGEAFEFGEYGLDGTLRRTFSRPAPRRPVTQDMLDVLRAEDLARVRGENRDAQEARINRRYLEGPIAETLPAYQRFLVDGADNVWAQAFEAPGDRTVTWSVFDPDAEYLGEVTVPAEMELRDVGENTALVVWTDPLDVQTLRLYDLIKP